MASFMKMPLPAPWAPPEAQPVAVNAAKVTGGLFIAMQATGATIGKAPKKAENCLCRKMAFNHNQTVKGI